MWFNYSPSKHLRWVLKSLGSKQIKRVACYRASSCPPRMPRGCQVRPVWCLARPPPAPSSCPLTQTLLLPWSLRRMTISCCGKEVTVALFNQAHHVFLFLAGTTIIKVFSSLLKTCAIRNSLSTWRYHAENTTSPLTNSFSPCVVHTLRICS